MANYLTEGNKTVYCKHGHGNTVPFQTTVFKCSTCDCICLSAFFGTIVDNDGNYIY